jgi:rhamnosyltransferase
MPLSSVDSDLFCVAYWIKRQGGKSGYRSNWPGHDNQIENTIALFNSVQQISLPPGLHISHTLRTIGPESGFHFEESSINIMPNRKKASREIPSRENIGAVIVTHQPDHGLESMLHSITGRAGKVVIVDNNSRPEVRDWLQSLTAETGCTLLLNEQNLGVAAGLNQGIRFVADRGCAWALMLDQDSKPAPDMVESLCQGYSRLINPEETAILAPRIVDASTGREAPFLTRSWGFFFRRVTCSTSVIDNITTAITSGALLRIVSFIDMDGYREDFFIDYVDTEFCLRLQINGWRLAAICSASIDHHLGKRTRTRIGTVQVYPTHHSPLRWYTIGRNRIQMLKTYAMRFPHWLAYELAASAFITLRMLLTEKERIAKLRASFQGTWDGLRGRMGPPP